MGKKEIVIIGIICILLILPIISAGVFGDLWSKITGKASSQNVDLNITVTAGSAPTIPRVDNQTATVVDGPNEGPSSSYLLINFTAYDTDGFGNLNDSSATAIVGLTGELNRTNSSCALIGDYDTNYANYTCNVTMWWFDGAGDWEIYASISDANTNTGKNYSETFSIGTTDGIENNITAVQWPSISPGATDTSASNAAHLNNTGNMNQWLEVNATDITGELNSNYALGASNFSVNGSGSCQGGVMVHNTYLNISDASLPKGNYTPNDGTAQEILFFCIEESNADLIAQYYSTGAENSTGQWAIRVQNQ
jgi:hypothetical protein